MAAIPFLFGAAGMLVNGSLLTGWSKGEWLRLKAVRSAYCRDVLFCRLYAGRTASDNIMTAVLLIGMALFCIHFAGTSAGA